MFVLIDASSICNLASSWSMNFIHSLSFIFSLGDWGVCGCFENDFPN